jgi:hypothetical protein
MIDRYTIKFRPAVSQKELEKVMATGESKFNPEDLKKMKARIDVIGDFEDLKKITAILKDMVKREPQ